MKVIETRNLDFAFSKKELVLNNLSLEVEQGSIYGFIGANGSGKTTTIRILLGLLPTAGYVRLFGRPLEVDRINIFSKIGCLIEEPSLYSHLSGRRNLEITAQM